MRPALAENPTTLAANQVVMRLNCDIIVAAPSREECQKAIELHGDLKAWKVGFTVIRDESGWVNPAYRVTDDGTTLTVAPKPRTGRTARRTGTSCGLSCCFRIYGRTMIAWSEGAGHFYSSPPSC